MSQWSNTAVLQKGWAFPERKVVARSHCRELDLGPRRFPLPDSATAQDRENDPARARVAGLSLRDLCDRARMGCRSTAVHNAGSSFFAIPLAFRLRVADADSLRRQCCARRGLADGFSHGHARHFRTGQRGQRLPLALDRARRRGEYPARAYAVPDSCLRCRGAVRARPGAGDGRLALQPRRQRHAGKGPLRRVGPVVRESAHRLYENPARRRRQKRIRGGAHECAGVADGQGAVPPRVEFFQGPADGDLPRRVCAAHDHRAGKTEKHDGGIAREHGRFHRPEIRRRLTRENTTERRRAHRRHPDGGPGRQGLLRRGKRGAHPALLREQGGRKRAGPNREFLR